MYPLIERLHPAGGPVTIAAMGTQRVTRRRPVAILARTLAVVAGHRRARHVGKTLIRLIDATRIPP